MYAIFGKGDTVLLISINVNVGLNSKIDIL